MTVDRRTAAWAARYQELLQGLTHALGSDIPPAKLAICRTAAVLQTELTMLGDQFASGRGASGDDLNTFIKISATIGGLLQSIGLDQVLQRPPTNDRASGDDARAKLLAMVNNHVRARETEHAQGIFRDNQHRVITNPERLQIAQEIYRLQQQAEAIDNDTTPPPAAEPLVITKVPPPPPPDLRVVKPASSKPAPPSDIPGMYAAAGTELSTTEKFYQWSGHTRPP
jgi:hypothetical protein